MYIISCFLCFSNQFEPRTIIACVMCQPTSISVAVSRDDNQDTALSTMQRVSCEHQLRHDSSAQLEQTYHDQAFKLCSVADRLPLVAFVAEKFIIMRVATGSW